jgi:CIC family chloride channel protein
MEQRSSPSATPSHPMRWFPEFLELSRKRLQPQARLLGLSLLVGIIAGVGAVAFHAGCQVVVRYSLEAVAHYYPQGPRNEPPLWDEMPVGDRVSLNPWLLLLVPTVGGLLSGFLVYSLAPEAEGHGTDAAIAAYHFKGGQIRPRVPLVKLIASAITLGTGGSGGREGPIAQIGAGFGSFLGGLLRLRPAERRVLMAAGMGAGVAAIFRAPLAGALFAAEVLYRSPDFESEVIIPAALASITAYCTFGLCFGHTGLGWKSLFYLNPATLDVLNFTNPWRLGSYLLLALFMVVLAMVYTRSFYGLTYLFRRLPFRPHLRPALGAFLSAAVALVLLALLRDQRVLAVLSFGYGVLQEGLELSPDKADLGLALFLLAVALGKILTTGLTIGSGGSGGVFGPSMVIGGCGGGALGLLLHWLWSPLAPQPADFMIVGMAGFFAAAAKTPFSTLVMVGELTGNYNLLLPTLWVCSIAFLLSDEQSIYSQQVASRSLSPAHQGDYVREVLAGLRVGQFLGGQHKVPTLRPSDRLPEIIECLDRTPYHGLPVTDPEGRYLGMVSLEEVHLASLSPDLSRLVVAADLMRADITPLQPDDTLDRALELFVESDRLTLAVVDGSPERHVIGIVRRADVSTNYLRRVHGVHAPSGQEGAKEPSASGPE